MPNTTSHLTESWTRNSDFAPLLFDASELSNEGRKWPLPTTKLLSGAAILDCCKSVLRQLLQAYLHDLAVSGPIDYPIPDSDHDSVHEREEPRVLSFKALAWTESPVMRECLKRIVRDVLDLGPDGLTSSDIADAYVSTETFKGALTAHLRSHEADALPRKGAPS